MACKSLVSFIFNKIKSNQIKSKDFIPGGVVLPIMAYTGRLRPKGVPFSGFRYIKG